MKLKLFWNKSGERYWEPPKLDSTNILINGKLLTCIGLSIASGFIDLVFFSNISKSLYELFGFIAIPAGALMAFISIWFTIGKFFTQLQIGAMEELQTKLRGFGYNWAENLNKPKRKWKRMHWFLVGISVLTTISLSVISIGSGITRNANTIKQIDSLIEQGSKFSNLLATASQTQLTAIVSQSKDTSQEDAIKYVQENITKIMPVLESYKNDRTSFESNYGANAVNSNRKDLPETDGKSASEYWTIRNQEVNNLLGLAGYGNLTGPQIKKLDRSQVEKALKENYMTIYGNSNNSVVMEGMNQLKDSTAQEAEGWLNTLNASNFQSNIQVIEEGKRVWKQVPVEFDTDPEKLIKVKVDSALMKLKAFRVDVENDSGDIGTSAKIFMMVGSYFNKDATMKDAEEALNTKVSTGMGPTEVMLMIVLMIIGLAQEMLIALFTPKAIINRKLLSQFNQYFNYEQLDLNRFLIHIYNDYLELGVLSQERYNAKMNKAIEMIAKKESNWVERLIEEKKNSFINRSTLEPEEIRYSHKVTEAVQEIEALLNN